MLAIIVVKYRECPWFQESDILINILSILSHSTGLSQQPNEESIIIPILWMRIQRFREFKIT